MVRMNETNKLELFLAEKQRKQDEKKIVMLSDKVCEFDSIKDAVNGTGISYSALKDNINNKSQFTKDKSGFKVKFMRKSEYNKLTKDEIDSILAEIDGLKLVLLNTGEEFKSIHILSDYINTDKTNIYTNLSGKNKSCGKLNGEKCVIKYKRDYIKLSEDDVKELVRNANSRVKRKTTKRIRGTIVLFNTGEVFNSRKEIYSKYGVGSSNISKALKHSKTHIGGYKCNIPLLWFCEEDYNNLAEEAIRYYNQVIKENTKQNIILYNNGKIYTKDFIVNTLNISSDNLYNCLGGRANHAGRYKGYPLIWMYENKYNSLVEKDKKELNEYIKTNSTRFYFVNENKPFYNIAQFSKDYNIVNISIQKCLHKKLKSTVWKEDERAIFIYLDEFNNMSEEEREKYLAECEIERYKKYKDYTPKPVKSYTEGIEFDSQYEAGKYYGIDNRGVSRSVKNNEWIVDEDNKPLKFERIEREE